MAVINTNVKALFSQNALTNSGRAQSLAMQQLSTGKRINSARDDAAGMAIATRMTQQIRGLNQAVRNAGDAINLIQTAEGATNEITDMMQRMRELAVQAVNDTNDNAQRSYLDLEFQQLKQQIVQISNNTEWNGFPVLNGTAGERVGEMPVFKVTSENQYGSVFINPTTSRTVAGTDAGEKQTMLIAGTMSTLTGSQSMTITVGGVDVVLDATTAATASTVATQIQQTLSNNAAFNASSGRTVTVSGATLTITYAASDGNVADTSFDPKAATLVTATVSTTREAIAQGGESFKGNGAFLNSGALTMSADTAGVVTASFKTNTGETIPMQGILNNSAVTETSAVTFNAMTAGQSITLGGLTYTASVANTAAQVAAAFASLSNGATTGVTTNGTFIGTLSGFSSGAVSTSTVTFTSASTGTDVTNMPISGSGALPTVVVTQGAPAGSITFIKDSGLNAKVISDDLVYAFKKSDATAATLTSRAFSYSVSVEGSIPALRAGDLKINGIDIGASYATDDKLSPVGNAAGSAIAKAAAINRMAVATGVTQGEAQMLTFSGTPAPGTLTVAGVSVTITALDTTTAAVATKVAAALQASPLFAASTGRVVTYIPGNSNPTIKYAPSEGNMPETVIQTGATGVTGLVDTLAEHFISSAGTGVFAKVNENVMTGRAMTGTSVVKGTVFINGFASADITTVLNNSRETRANVVRAINLISDKTGVKAIDTGVDAKGITLTAADGRNIEVSFETSANADDFGSRIGLRQGVQSSTISLESKIPAPVVLTSDSTGDIKRAGLISGNFSKNEAVANTSPRAIVGPNVAQVESVTYSGTVPVAGDTFSLTVNGTTFTYTANATDGLTTQAVRNGLVALINANTTLPVTANAGRNKGEILLTADSAGTSFTLTNSKSNATTTVTAATVKANAKADFKPLGMDDLVINGVKIPASIGAGDIDSNTIATSSDPASSALAIAAAINSQTPLTGVLAKANGAEIKGTRTVTSLPVLSVPTFQSLFINGTEIKVQFVQNESATDRLNKVAEAINQRSGAHGVVATNNGNGISLKSDGRNMSVWFDSNVKDLSAANFGLDQGGAVAQIEKITISTNTDDIPTVTQTATYIEFSNYGTSNENLGIPDFNGYDINGSGPASIAGVISFYNKQLYRGNGIHPIVIGNVDNTLDGANGKHLRINLLPNSDNQFYNTSNQHYYEVVDSNLSWSDARSAALNKNFLGLNGYLANISDSSEQAFIASRLAGKEGWIGASDLGSEGNWKWMDGPESGNLFFMQALNQGSGYVVNGNYLANTSTGAPWDSGEPNNSGDEDYAYLKSNGAWNDYPNSAAVASYVVEYGGVGGSLVNTSLTATELSSLRSKVIYTNSGANTDTATISINGVNVTSTASARNSSSIAVNLEAAINEKISNGEIKNILVTRNGAELTLTSKIAGSPFSINGASTNYSGNSINIFDSQINSYGNNQITGIRDATATSTTARTVYGTVRMIAQPPNLPGLPKPIGAPPSEMDKLLLANAKPFIVSSGADGFGVNSNFSALGFNEGSFGGRSSSDMDPPKVGRLAFQVGSSANQTVTIDLADFGKEGPITGEITGDVDKNVEQRSVRINTREGASDVLTKLDSAMDKINATRATMGAVMNRLDHVINNLTNVSMNLSTSRSGIEDADYASSSTELAKTQIMQQAATAVLAQANISQQTVLNLLESK